MRRLVLAFLLALLAATPAAASDVASWTGVGFEVCPLSHLPCTYSGRSIVCASATAGEGAVGCEATLEATMPSGFDPLATGSGTLSFTDPAGASYRIKVTLTRVSYEGGTGAVEVSGTLHPFTGVLRQGSAG